MKQTRKVGISVSPETDDTAEAIAAVTGLGKGQVFELAIADYAGALPAHQQQAVKAVCCAREGRSP